MAQGTIQQEDIDLTLLDHIVEEAKSEDLGLIPILQRAQKEYGYLPKPVLERVSEKLSLPYNRVFGVATFYSQFHLTPRGRHIVQLCDGTACHVRGAPRIMRAIKERTGISPGETTDDLKLTYEVVYCLGSCGLSPVAMIDGSVVGRLTPEKMVSIIDSLD
jgi:NADH-quinone oxidoreductase subunit E